jgi:hypothetical protein
VLRTLSISVRAGVNEGFKLGTLECARESTLVFDGYSCILWFSKHREAIETAIEVQRTKSSRAHDVRRKYILIGIAELRSNLYLEEGGLIIIKRTVSD